MKQYNKTITGSQYQDPTFISYLLSNNRFLNFLLILCTILLYFQIFDNLWCIPANYEKNERVIKNSIVIFELHFIFLFYLLLFFVKTPT